MTTNGRSTLEELVNPPVSVVIPTYNRGEVLCQTMALALAQDYPDFEVIVVDQSAAPPQAVLSFVRTAPTGLRYFRLSTPNLPAARNFGVGQARGEIIVFIDDDVIVGPEYAAMHARNYRDVSESRVGARTHFRGRHV